MATKKRAGLGRGLGALIPQAPTETRDRAIDVFFDGSAPSGRDAGSKQADARLDGSEIEESLESTRDDVSVAVAGSAREVTIAERETEREHAAGGPADGSSEDSAGMADSTATSLSPRPAADSGTTDAAALSAVTPAPVQGATTDATRLEADRADTATGSGTIRPDDRSTTSRPDTTQSDVAQTDAAQLDAAKLDSEDVTEVVTEDDDSALLPIPGASLRTLDPMSIVPNARQPRHEFDQEALDELIVSVREFGVLQPIVVRPLPAGDARRSLGEYELIMGERRLRATKASGRAEIPAIVRHTDDEDMLRDALLENLHRADLNPIEEASAYRQLLDDFGCTQEVLAERIGRSRPRISNTLRLLNLPVDVQRKVAAGVLSAGHARAILSLGEPAAMQQLSDKIINEELSVRDAEAAASRHGTRAGRRDSTDAASGSNSISAYLDEVSERLGDRLNTRVRCTLRKTKGQITVEFASVADLKRILEEIGEGDDE